MRKSNYYWSICPTSSSFLAWESHYFSYFFFAWFECFAIIRRKKILNQITLINFQQQAVVERFALCEENISILLKWINDIEQRLSKIGGPQEHIEELHSQINVLKVNFNKNQSSFPWRIFQINQKLFF